MSLMVRSAATNSPRCCVRNGRRGPPTKTARHESSLDASLCRRLSRRHRPPDHDAARGVSAADDALLAQGRTARGRQAIVQDHKAAAEDLVRLSPDLAGFFPRGLEAQADRRRIGEDGARARKARDRGAEGGPRLGPGAHEAGKCLALPAGLVTRGLVTRGLAASNCRFIVERRRGSRRPLTLKLTSEPSGGWESGRAAGPRALTPAPPLRG